MRTVGPAVAAVFALAGLVASVASAAPEWKGCVKTEPKNTGSYTDKLCTAESSTGEGAFELVPSVGKGKGFKGKGGATTLRTRTGPCQPGAFCPGPPEFQITCSAVKYRGKLALPNLIKEAVFEFKGCKLLTSPCQSGVKKGVIVANALAGEVVDIEGGSGVGSLLEPEAGPSAPLATFTCTEVATLSLLGSMIAERTGDVGTVSREAQDHFVVGPGLGEVTWEGKEMRGEHTPLVNVPTHQAGGSTGEHFLVLEFTEFGQTELYTLPSGLEGATEEKGEALMIAP